MTITEYVHQLLRVYGPCACREIKRKCDLTQEQIYKVLYLGIKHGTVVRVREGYALTAIGLKRVKAKKVSTLF